MIPNIGPMEIGIVLVIALLVFGPKKLPELGNSIGSGMREFKQGLTDRDSPEVELEKADAVENPEVAD